MILVKKPKEILSEKFNFIIHEIFSQDVINGEIIIKGTNKGNAVQFVTKKLGLSLEDTIGFGDSMNDYEMINFVECGIAMGNACKELKEVASRVCRSVDEDGIYYEFIELGLI